MNQKPERYKALWTWATLHVCEVAVSMSRCLTAQQPSPITVIDCLVSSLPMLRPGTELQNDVARGNITGIVYIRHSEIRNFKYLKLGKKKAIYFRRFLTLMLTVYPLLVKRLYTMVMLDPFSDFRGNILLHFWPWMCFLSNNMTTHQRGRRHGLGCLEWDRCRK